MGLQNAITRRHFKFSRRRQARGSATKAKHGSPGEGIGSTSQTVDRCRFVEASDAVEMRCAECGCLVDAG